MSEHIIITSIVHSQLEALEVSPLLMVLPLRGLRSYAAAAAELQDSFTSYLVIVLPWPICSGTAKDAVDAALHSHSTRTATHPAGPRRPWSATAPLPRAAPYLMATPAMVVPATGSLAGEQGCQLAHQTGRCHQTDSSPPWRGHPPKGVAGRRRWGGGRRAEVAEDSGRKEVTRRSPLPWHK